VLNDLVETFAPETLLEVARSYHTRASVQRLGYILESPGYVETVTKTLFEESIDAIMLSKGNRIHEFNKRALELFECDEEYLNKIGNSFPRVTPTRPIMEKFGERRREFWEVCRL